MPRLLGWAANTAMLSAWAVALIVPLALGMAYAARVVATRWMSTLVAVAASGYAIPGIVLGVGLLGVVGVVEHTLAGHMQGLLVGGTAVAVVYAYCVRFFSVA